MIRSPYLNKRFVKEIIRFGQQQFLSILQQKIQPQLSLDQQNLKPIITSLKHTAYYNGLISLSSNQINFKKRIFVIMKKNFIKYGKWNNYEENLLQSNKKPEEIYDAIINPDIISHSQFKIKGDEECPSIQGLRFKVWLPLTNRIKFVRYLEEYQRQHKSTSKNIKDVNVNAFKMSEQTFNGFYGRVFDHEYRHLQGILSNDQDICHDQIYLSEEFKSESQNYDFLKDYRLQREYFDEQNLQKHILKEIQQNKKKNNGNMMELIQKMKSKLDFSKITDKISDEMKNKLLKSYESAKKSGNLVIPDNMQNTHVNNLSSNNNISSNRVKITSKKNSSKSK